MRACDARWWFCLGFVVNLHRLGNDSMNLPNLITLSRVPLMFLIVGLLYVDHVGVATATFLLFVAAGITDWLDGHLARKRGLVSNFGILMDAVTDKVLLLGIMIALVHLNRVPTRLGDFALPAFIPVFLVLLILGREFLITGMRLVAASKGVVVAADKGGKQKTMTQILAVGAFLLAQVVRLDFAGWFAAETGMIARGLDYAGLALFVVATAFTLSSGVRYFRRYGALVFAN
jgi:CDP-diacylglycerol---glycerol-3-phosphate 3-phosphatidyltransferase